MKSRFLHSKRSGMTLVELAISMGLIAMTLGSAMLMSSTSQNAYRTTMAAMELEQKLHKALQRAAAELTMTGASHLDPPDPAEGIAFDSIEFQRVTGNAGAAPTLGPADRLAMELAEGEVDDGVDNDGDGLVDEQQLVFRTNVGTADEQRIVLCSNILEFLEGETEDGADENGNLLADEAGFHFVRAGNVLTLRLSIGGFDQNGWMITRTAELSVRMRN